jgi:phage pi2 protein 07
MSEVLLLVGTRKGLWVGRSDTDRAEWKFEGPHFLMNDVYGMAIDIRSEPPRVLVGTMSSHFGPQVLRSDDLARSWDETLNGAIKFPEDTEASLERVWQLAPAPAGQPGVVYAGTEPSALFKSTDNGETFTMVRGLWDHPHRERWGAGYGGQAIHTILPHPTNPAKLTVAMSTGGVYQTEDAGESWHPSNKGVKAYFFPDPWPEFGQCVHKVARHPSRPERMYLQNHHGVYRTDNEGESWESIADGLPSDFGFAMVVDPNDAETIYVFPLVADRERIPPETRPRVWRSHNGGDDWEELGEGLPPDGFYAAVMRDAMCADGADPTGLYFGTRDGCVFASSNGGDSWTEVARHLPDVMCVRAAVVD